MAIKFKEKFHYMPVLLTVYKGALVNLKGKDIETTIKNPYTGEDVKVVYKGATEAILKDLLNNPKEHGDWNYMLEMTNEPSPVTAPVK